MAPKREKSVRNLRQVFEHCAESYSASGKTLNVVLKVLLCPT